MPKRKAVDVDINSKVCTVRCIWKSGSTQHGHAQLFAFPYPPPHPQYVSSAMTDVKVSNIVLTITPPTSVSVNTLTYPPIHTAYIPAPTEAPVLLTLPTEAPSPTFIFLYLAPNTVTHLHYDSLEEALTPVQTPRKPGLPGTPGVAVVRTTFWDCLSCYITPSVLSHASISETGSDTPSFKKLPALAQGLSGSELTSFYHDRTTYLRSLVDVRYDGVYEALLGEVQLAFLVYSMLMDAEGLDRWTRLVGEICRADHELRPGLSQAFSNLLEAQLSFLKRCSGDAIVGVIVTELSEEFTRFLDNFPSTVLKRVLTENGWMPDQGDAPIVVC